ncbi:MAG: hypothetical protein RR929_01060 [Erysipelotrichaceae bacterium]
MNAMDQQILFNDAEIVLHIAKSVSEKHKISIDQAIKLVELTILWRKN